MKTIKFIILLVFISSTALRAQFISAGQHGSSIFYHDIIPDTTIYGIHNHSSGLYDIDINGDNITDFEIESCDCSGLGSGYPHRSITPYNNNEVSILFDDTCYEWPPNIYSIYQMVHPYNFNQVINNQEQWKSNIAALSYYVSNSVMDSSFQNHHYTCWNSTFSNSTPLYIGVRVFALSDTLYGWIKVEGITNYQVTIDEYACEKILVGIDSKTIKPTFNFYPNPAKNLLRIDISQLLEDSYELSINDLLGNRLLERKINKGNSEIDISNLSNGIYFVKIESANYSATKKLIKK